VNMQTDSQQTEGAVAVRSGDLFSDSPTWPYVLAFAQRMEAKLAKNRHKGDRNGWINCNPDELAFRIRDELAELEDALRLVRHKENIVASEREQIANEAADVANFAMMIADIYTGAKSPNAGGER
jgi:NTP pyrophosphatase (non-canonical NTP hydrolase)